MLATDILDLDFTPVRETLDEVNAVARSVQMHEISEGDGIAHLSDLFELLPTDMTRFLRDRMVPSAVRVYDQWRASHGHDAPPIIAWIGVA